MLLFLGPSHAEEIVRNYPTTVVAAAEDEKAAKEIQNIMMSKTFRVYTTNDIIGGRTWRGPQKCNRFGYWNHGWHEFW